MTEPFRVPAREIAARIQNLQNAMEQTQIEGMFIVQKIDLFYFSGTAQNGSLFVPARGEPTLFVRKYMPRAEIESSIGRKIEITSIKEVPEYIAHGYGSIPRVLGFELDVMPVNEFVFLKSLFSPADCVDGSGLIHSLRMIKSPWEIARMEETAALSGKVFTYIRETIHSGISEMEFSGMYETYARKLGHAAQLRVRDYKTPVYNWHILSGTNGGVVGLLDAPASGMGTSPAVPCGGSAKLLAPGEPIMIDIGTNVNGYHMDETRMYALESMPETAMAACRAVNEIHDAVLDMAGPGVTVDALFEESVSLAGRLGYDRQFLGPEGYKVSFIGHGIGLELVEPPFIAKGRRDVLQPGMMIALEPKMVFEHQYSAGIESVFLVTETGARLISTVPVDVFIA